MRKRRRELPELKDKVYLIGWNNSFQFMENERIMIYEYQRSGDEFLKMEINKENNNMQLFIMDYKRNILKYIGENESAVGIVDLSYEGDRWEGSHWEKIPFGYGCLFDKDNRRIYEGYMADGKKVCLGTEYYDDEVIQYRGNYVNNYRHGYGCLYDKKGGLLYEGEWANDQNDHFNAVILNSFDNDGMVHNLVRNLTIGNDCYNDLKELIMNDYPNLTVFIVGKNSFYSTTSLSFSSI